MISLYGCAGAAGIGSGAEEVFVEGIEDVDCGRGNASRCLRDEYMAAVTLAPAAADTPAMIAKVVFDIFEA